MPVYLKADYSDFAERLRKRGRQSAEVVLERVRIFGRDAYRGVVHDSPVKTGQFRASWNLSLNGPDDRLPPQDRPAYPAPGDERLSALASLKVGDTVWLSNAQPYAQRLANGWSKQAPPGWLQLIRERALLAARQGRVNRPSAGGIGALRGFIGRLLGVR